MNEKNKLQINDTMPDNFEDGIKELERLVDKIESREINLEESIKIYERAQFLSKWCVAFLEKSEQKINLLLHKADGSFELEDFKKTKD
jgi:exodeoxyribonuclease VII small subunit